MGQFNNVRLCVYCDKRLSSDEVENLTEDEIRHYFILCKKHLQEHRAEVQAIIDEPDVDHRRNRTTRTRDGSYW